MTTTTLKQGQSLTPLPNGWRQGIEPDCVWLLTDGATTVTASSASPNHDLEPRQLMVDPHRNCIHSDIGHPYETDAWVLCAAANHRVVDVPAEIAQWALAECRARLAAQPA